MSDPKDLTAIRDAEAETWFQSRIRPFADKGSFRDGWDRAVELLTTNEISSKLVVPALVFDEQAAEQAAYDFAQSSAMKELNQAVYFGFEGGAKWQFDSLAERVRSLEQRCKELNDLSAAMRDAEKYEAEITRLRSALEFYACWTNWSQVPGKPDVYSLLPYDCSEVPMHGKEKPDMIAGKRARQALNAPGGGE